MNKLGISRRAVARFLGAAPVLGTATLASQGSAAYPPNTLRDIMHEAQIKGNIGDATQAGALPRQPLVSHTQAVAKILADPILRQKIEAEAWQNHRRVFVVDDDIAAMRSFSHMAKITFQRQRNVQREIEEIQKPPPWETRGFFETAVRKIMWGNN